MSKKRANVSYEVETSGRLIVAEGTLKQKQSSSTKNLLADVLQFLGWLTLVFAIQDLIVNGSWRKLLQMTLSADGRLLILFVGVGGVIVGWSLRDRK